ncbi:class I SAM-dependent methyltransferase [Azomonas macrocytogenes]|uniref:Ubiquinone/menaquinone biosynthesis C-methylase UbiE n=1 Tax=Azomonas macrocytogenes TaxID=69962 RepID=A0A839T2N5_AZOMA|nr:class I SAM-dependent methyltransferase [Azomonas macrocytogenes]MBB3102746.1 ubiquinone/menaquinone biosynthesis C-methylase UbiE [Azomonas macrocytogenes]
MSTSFSDHFKNVSRQYAESRPTYPPELFAWLAAQSPATGHAWDCATGNGQAALDLAQHFQQVTATDASAAQIGQAIRHERIDYRVAPAEASGLAAGSIDLVVVAQALHWFAVERFHAEATRVLKPGGVIAEWSYGVLTVEGAEVDALVQHFYHDVVGPWWPAERRHVENGYRELEFPFQPIAAPTFTMRINWNLERLLGYFRSWSATARYRENCADDPVAALAQRLRPVWGVPELERKVCWPLALRVGRAAASG